MVTPPNPPLSRQLISPFVAVFEIAPAKVLQGAVRLQGLASSPTPETQVRLACAWAGDAIRQRASIAPARLARVMVLLIFLIHPYMRKTPLSEAVLSIRLSRNRSNAQ
jgi:hypothetical protein